MRAAILHARALLRSLVALSVAASAPAFAQAEVTVQERPFSGRVSLEARLPDRSDPAGSLSSWLDLRVRQSLSESVWASGALELHVAPGFGVPYADLTLGTRLGDDPTRTLAVTLMPVSTSRERLGFDPLLGFGGKLYQPTRAFASRAQLDLQRWQVWAAAQTTVVVNPLTLDDERLFAPSAGLGYQTPQSPPARTSSAVTASWGASSRERTPRSSPVSLRWAPVSALRVFAEATGAHDANRTQLVDDASGNMSLVADDPWVFGGDVMLQLVL